MMSLEQKVRELVAAARNTQQRHKITLFRGLNVVARVNSKTDRLEILTYRELDPKIDKETQAKIPRSSCLEAEVVTRAAGGTWNSPHNLETVKWMPWQIVEQSPEEVAAILLERQRLAKIENEKREIERIQDRVEVCVQLMLEVHKTHSGSVEIYSALWREGLAQFPSQVESKIVEAQQVLKHRKLKQKRVERKSSETIATA
jgi:hypothetical protein